LRGHCKFRLALGALRSQATVMNELLIVAFLLGGLGVLDVSAILFGYDSRDGIGDTRRRG